jgi:hypothetical protein
MLRSAEAKRRDLSARFGHSFTCVGEWRLQASRRTVRFLRVLHVVDSDQNGETDRGHHSLTDSMHDELMQTPGSCQLHDRHI